MLTFFQQAIAHHHSNASIITIGKQITDYIRQLGIEPRAQYNELTPANFVAIAHELATAIVHQSLYQLVTVFSTQPVTFFLQKQRETTILPFQHSSTTQSSDSHYILEQQPTDIARSIEQLQIKISLQILLFESLLAEQASRFLSMDAATRNADTMLIDMKRDYNKIRQAAITLELIDFASNSMPF
jgi:F-type H+-transporting ATPase subunit gamma